VPAFRPFRSFALSLAFAVFSSSFLLAVPARAQPTPTPTPHPAAYAILVGSNEGGAGQAPLRYAEDDARSVAQVLRELGRYGDADLRLLVRPDPAKVLAAIDDVAARLRARTERGEQAVLVFYYSGHARANAVSLGADELPLATLRERLRAVPTTLTIVVLDACQSGSFARVKGAEPAADFSFNSVSRLTQRGIAVMASSTAQELSQESDELRSSYFTHHLVVALRGAGDADADGRVSLDEAYRYAYRRTLAATTRTQVGGQHVTLETDLSGQGEVPVTYPAEAKSQLELPGPLEGRILVQHVQSGAIAAEVQKAKGPPLRLAFVSGAYDVTVRAPGAILQCHAALADNRVASLDLHACTPAVAAATSAKGDGADGGAEPDSPSPPVFGRISELDRWRLELGVGLRGHIHDAYVDRLNEFGYEEPLLPPAPITGSVGVSRAFSPAFAAVLQTEPLASGKWVRDLGAGNQHSDFVATSGFGSGIYLRATYDVAWFGVYAQAGGGISVGSTTFSSVDAALTRSTTDHSIGYLVGGAIGANFSMKRYVSFFGQLSYLRAPTVSNLIGDTHDLGGVALTTGIRLGTGENR